MLLVTNMNSVSWQSAKYFPHITLHKPHNSPMGGTIINHILLINKLKCSELTNCPESKLLQAVKQG